MKFFLFILISLISTQVFAEGKVKLYKSYSHYIGNIYEEYEFQDFDQNFYTSGYAKPKLTVKRDGKKVKIDLLEYWCFVYRDILFRREDQAGTYQALLSSGKLFYWESAELILLVLDRPEPKSILGGWPYISILLSKSIDGEMKMSNELTQFFEENPELKQVALCYNNKTEYNINKLYAKIKKLGDDTDLQALIYITDLFTETYNRSERKILRDCVKEFNGNFLPIFDE